MTQRIIEVIVSPKGEATLQTKGFAGGECLQASKFLEEALGIANNDRKTAEYTPCGKSKNSKSTSSRPRKTGEEQWPSGIFTAARERDLSAGSIPTKPLPCYGAADFVAHIQVVSGGEELERARASFWPSCLNLSMPRLYATGCSFSQRHASQSSQHSSQSRESDSPR